jgi:hypothetical protein
MPRVDDVTHALPTKLLPGSGHNLNEARKFDYNAALRLFSDCLTNVPGSAEAYCCWKHGFARLHCEDEHKAAKLGYKRAYVPYTAVVTHLMVVRNPYPWLLTMYKKPYEYDGYGWRKQTFDQFLARDFNYKPRGYFHAKKRDRNANPMVMWNRKIRSYLDLDTPRKLLLTHGELFDVAALRAKLAAFNEAQVSHPAEQRGFKFHPERFVLPPWSSGGNKFKHEFTQEGFHQAKVLESSRAWETMYTQRQLDFINARLDFALMNHFGFEKLSHPRGETFTEIVQDRGLDPAQNLSAPGGAQEWLDYLDGSVGE